VLAPMGLRLSPARTQVVHLSDGFDFLGFRIQWKRKRGTAKWYACSFNASRPIRSLKDKVRALTSRTSQWPSRDTLIRLNQIMRGWVDYFRRGLQVHTRSPGRLVWHRVIRWQMRLHRWGWKDVRKRLTGPGGQWRRPSADGIELFNLGSVSVTRYLYRGSKIPSPWISPDHA
jgi:RNA-directed DNA polymerase